LSSLREKLKALEELQKVDLEIHEAENQSKGFPGRQAAVEAKVADARKAYETEKNRLADNERERRQIDSLLVMERDKVKKWEGRLGEIKTPREYAALSREIDIAKKTNEAQSEQIKTLQAAAVEIEKSLEEKEEALANREAEFRGELAAITTQADELKARIAALVARRADEATKVDPSLLSKYEAIKRRRAGVAVVPVIGTTCRGCNMGIPPQLANILRRADSIELCPTCRRIIYSEEAVNPPSPAPA
jgi:predicted  nucleic acid-binding Zn-ribbon protein